MTRTPFSDVMVVLPGIMGSVLQKDGKDLWALSGSAFVRFFGSLGGSLKQLRLDGDSPELIDLGDGITPARLMPDVHLIPRFWKIDGYTGFTSWIQRTFDVKWGHNYFEFPYDWRRDNRASARLLANCSHGWLRQWRERSGNSEARLCLVAHSMGGLIARYFLECLEGWRVTRHLITLGTPYRGSLNALDYLANGYAASVLGQRLPEIGLISNLVAGFTSIYQLLPTFPCVLTEDNSLARISDIAAAIPNINADLLKAANEMHAELDSASAANRKDPDFLNNGYKIVPFVGAIQQTYQSAVLADGSLKMSFEHPGHDLQGDGTVPHGSALPLEHQTNGHGGGGTAIILTDRHACLQNSNATMANIRNVMGGFRTSFSFRGKPHGVLLDIEDAYLTGEPIAIRVRVDGIPDAGVVLDVRIESTDADMEPVEFSVDGDEHWFPLDLPPLAGGDYRVTVDPDHGDLDPVVDVFSVWDLEGG